MIDVIQQWVRATDALIARVYLAMFRERNALISFLVIAAVVYFLIVAPMARIMARFAKKVEATTRDCPECLSSIPIAATRCMYCTTVVAPETPPVIQ